MLSQYEAHLNRNIGCGWNQWSTSSMQDMSANDHVDTYRLSLHQMSF